MRATHKRYDSPDRLFSIVETTNTIYVNISGRGWRLSTWSGAVAMFLEGASPIATFKGNKQRRTV